MSDYYQRLAEQVRTRFGDQLQQVRVAHGELTVELPASQLLSVAQALRDETPFAFEQLIDLCAVDYATYGHGTIDGSDVALASPAAEGALNRQQWQGARFGIVYHLLSVTHNHRLRLRTWADGEVPVVDSVHTLWRVADWYEREAFDLFGVMFDGHPDLRRILTDYGFIGHPFRKDFPITGHVEMRYDAERQRVVYQPVTIEERNLVPRVIRGDHRYAGNSAAGESEGA